MIRTMPLSPTPSTSSLNDTLWEELCYSSTYTLSLEEDGKLANPDIFQCSELDLLNFGDEEEGSIARLEEQLLLLSDSLQTPTLSLRTHPSTPAGDEATTPLEKSQFCPPVSKSKNRNTPERFCSVSSQAFTGQEKPQGTKNGTVVTEKKRLVTPQNHDGPPSEKFQSAFYSNYALSSNASTTPPRKWSAKVHPSPQFSHMQSYSARLDDILCIDSIRTKVTFDFCLGENLTHSTNSCASKNGLDIAPSTRDSINNSSAASEGNRDTKSGMKGVVAKTLRTIVPANENVEDVSVPKDLRNRKDERCHSPVGCSAPGPYKAMFESLRQQQRARCHEEDCQSEIGNACATVAVGLPDLELMGQPLSPAALSQQLLLVKEETPVSAPTLATIPKDYDILMGRGNRSNRHPGNVRFRAFIQKYREVYQSAHIPDHKTALTHALLGLAKAPFLFKGHVVAPRFLNINKELNCWEVVDDEAARRKISHLLRINKSTKKK